MTAAGIVLGTAAYMSPEQARGLAVDKRTDIWAFGCVLYEMLTGRHAFQGATVTDILAAILEREPDWSGLPASTPPAVGRLLRRCLEKNGKQRLRDIADAAHELAEVAGPGSVATAPVATAAPRSRWRLALGGAVLLALGAALPLAFRSVPSPPVVDDGAAQFASTLTAATADDGISAEPALSADGALLAFTSDRAGKDDLDIWVQQTNGRVPIRLTHDDVDEHEPSFSPDGSRIVYRSERDGGAIYVTPTFGGGAARLLVEGGRRPRFSPDGTSVAYWTGSNIGFTSVAGAYRTFVVSSGGGTAREMAGFTMARYPVWSPDGQYLLLQGSRAPNPDPENIDWWLVPLDGASAMPLDIYTQLQALGTTLVQSTPSTIPDAWEGDRVFWSSGFVWSARIDLVAHRLEHVERLTFGTTQDRQISVSRDGRVALASFTEGNSVFGLPIDANRGTVLGETRRLTSQASRYGRASATEDGHVMAFLAGRPTSPGVMTKDLRSAVETDLGVAASGFGPAISPDGSLVAFERGGSVSAIPSKGGAGREICKDCQIGDWTSDGTSLVIESGRETSVARIDVGSLTRHDVLHGSGLSRPLPGPGNRLLAFRISANAATGQTNTVAVAPMSEGVTPESAWVRLTPPEPDARPCGWSPSGKLLYFVSGRDGTRCLYALRVHRQTGQPVGLPFAVQHFHGSRNLSGGQAAVLSTAPANAIHAGLFFYDLGERQSNIWLLSPAPRVK